MESFAAASLACARIGLNSQSEPPSHFQPQPSRYPDLGNHCKIKLPFGELQFIHLVVEAETKMLSILEKVALDDSA